MGNTGVEELMARHLASQGIHLGVRKKGMSSCRKGSTGSDGVWSLERLFLEVGNLMVGSLFGAAKGVRKPLFLFIHKQCKFEAMQGIENGSKPCRTATKSRTIEQSL